MGCILGSAMGRTGCDGSIWQRPGTSLDVRTENRQDFRVRVM